jgi:hypothetical protein
VKPLVLDDRSPSDKAVSIFAFKGCGLPTKQSQPVISKNSDIAKCFADEGMKAEVMMIADEGVPSTSFARSHEANADVIEDFAGIEGSDMVDCAHDMTVQNRPRKNQLLFKNPSTRAVIFFYGGVLPPILAHLTFKTTF